MVLRCSDPSQGQARWTLRLLADQMMVLGHVESTNYETVQQTLKKPNCNLEATVLGNSALAECEFVWHMKAVLDVDHRLDDSEYPLNEP
jgi:hypothetical protein